MSTRALKHHPAARRRQRGAAWRELLRTKQHCPALPLRQLARDASLCYRSAAKRWRDQAESDARRHGEERVNAARASMACTGALPKVSA